MGQDFGNSFLLQHAKDFFGELREGIVFTLMDIFVLNAQMASTANLVSWCPVDHDPPIPGVIRFFKESGAVPLAMSRFGEQAFLEAGLAPLYAPHGVDTNVYKPYDRAAVRKEVGIPDSAFLVGMVAANKGRPSRKGFQQAFQAFRVFLEKHDEALLYLHTVADPSVAAGEDLMAMIDDLKIADRVVLAPRYRMLHDPFPPATMARVYSSFDVLLNPSMGEGFGVPVLEAQSCGVPAIVTNFTAMPEVCGVGWKVGCRPLWTPGNSWMAVPDVPEIVSALEQCYDASQAEREQRSMAARVHALKYDADRVMDEYLLPSLKAAEERLMGNKRIPSVSRTELKAAA